MVLPLIRKTGNIILNQDNVIILGDFNVPNFNNPLVHDAKCQKMHDFLNLSNLRQFNSVCNSSGKLLDLAISNMNCEVRRDFAPLINEDLHHPSLRVNTLITDNRHINFSGNNNNIKKFNFRRADYPNLYAELLLTDWHFLNSCTDVNLACDMFYDRLTNIFEKHVPTYINHKRKYPPWYTSEIINNIKLKNYYRKKHKQTKLVNHLEQFKRLRSLVKADIQVAYKLYLDRVESNVKNDSKYFWNYIHSKKQQTRIPGKVVNNDLAFEAPQSVVDGFSDYFSSVYSTSTSTNAFDELNCFNYLDVFNIRELTEIDIINSANKLKNKMTSGHDQIPSFLVKDCRYAFITPLLYIFNLILKTSVFPDSWKTARVCPILKSGDPSLMTNYRPLSILCNFAKLFEISLYSYIYPAVKNLISPHQHGFMEGRSTITNLALFSQYAANALDNHGQVDVIYTDFAKAFDRIDHEIILTKLNNFGFHESLIALIRSYLTNRVQYVSYNGFDSKQFIATSGVPQGSNLGPLLFLLFINDLVQVIDCEKVLFADDLKIYHTIENVEDCLFIQNQLRKIEVWCDENNLQLNIQKCKSLTFTLKKQYIVFNYQLRSTNLCRCESIKDLGIVFDPKLSFTDHINQVTTSALRMLGFIIRNCRNFHDPTALKVLYFAYVRSKLEYGSLIWYPFYNVHELAVENVQRKFLKFMQYKISGAYPERGFSQHLLLNLLNFQSLHLRRVLFAVGFIYKLLHNKIDCVGLINQIIFRVPRLSTRVSTTFHLPVARTNILLRSPIYTMCNSVNGVAMHCDIHCNNSNELTRIVTDHINLI